MSVSPLGGVIAYISSSSPESCHSDSNDCYNSSSLPHNSSHICRQGNVVDTPLTTAGLPLAHTTAKTSAKCSITSEWVLCCAIT